MTRHLRTRFGTCAAWIAAVIFLPLIAGTAHAQRWEYFYGGPQMEQGHGGVQPVSSGGYISVASTNSTPTQDIYVVRTDDRGGKFWEATYDIAGNIDIPYDILELANGNFAITGYTSNSVNGVARRDMFILILDRCGAIVKFRTFGTPDYEEVGYDIIETRSGDPSKGTHVGDLVVAGYTTWTFPTRGATDAWLIRVDQANLNIIWSKRYEIGNGLEVGADDLLYALDECVSTPSLDSNNFYTSDIVAVGYTRSPYTRANPHTGAPSKDGLMLRVNGNTGLLPANTFPGTHGNGWDEELRSVEELEEPANANRGNIVAVGYTESTTPSREAYLVRTPKEVWRRINDRQLGDNATLPDDGFCVREIRSTDMGLTAGNLIVTGYVTTLPANIPGWGNQDVFLQEYQGTLVPVAPTTRIYGGTGDDYGWSCFPVGQKMNCRTPGFVACATSNSVLCNPANLPQMYLLKTNNVRSTNCKDANLNKVDAIPILPWDSLKANILDLNYYYDTTVKRTCQNWGCLICVTADLTVICPIPPCPAGNCGVNDTTPPRDTLITDTTRHDTINPRPCPPYCDSVPPMKPAPGLPGGADVSNRLVAIPNPVKVGEAFAIDMAMDREAHVDITVTDIQGELVTERTGTYKPGNRQFPIETDGWAPGAYLVKISDGTHSVTAKVVVTK
ncbi:MAG TPA: T9SS type A sorting domain-containing protein [Candidatus Kapabacteria bacterium]|nr:T9SS type A sorting domain-containing protein [Candidatus Kapabacteria bacterium]